MLITMEILPRSMVQGIPNLKFFKGGKIVDEIVGLVSNDELEAVVKKHL